MSVSLFSGDKLPKLPNDGYCYAVNEDGQRCGLRTKRHKKNGKWVYEKWCNLHNTDCKRHYETYKDSCRGFKYFKCSKQGTRLSESSKKLKIRECLNDREFFESKCYHESKRDQGHLLFLEMLEQMLLECNEILMELPVEELTGSATSGVSKAESLESKLEQLDLSVETEAERKQRMKAKQEKTREYQEIQKSEKKEKLSMKKELEKLEKEAMKEKEKMEAETLNKIYQQSLPTPKSSEREIVEQEALVNKILLQLDHEDKLLELASEIQTIKGRVKYVGGDIIYDRLMADYRNILKSETVTMFQKFEKIAKQSSKVVLSSSDRKFLERYSTLLTTKNNNINEMLQRAKAYKDKLEIKALDYYRKTLYQLKLEDSVMEMEILNKLSKQKSNLSDKEYEGRIKIIKMIFQEWNEKLKNMLKILEDLDAGKVNKQVFLDAYVEFIEWREKKLNNTITLIAKWIV